ncbi:MAG: IS1182 family transposase [Bryobacteraceae bacterium]
METDKQEWLVEIPEQPVAEKRPAPRGAAKLKPIDRSQGLLRTVIVDELVGPDHKARAMWELTGRWDLSGLIDRVKSEAGKAGRAAWNPRLLLSVWLYGYSEQVTSAREIERLMEYEPGLMWLSGLGEVNHHTLSDFRADNQEELKKLLGELLGLLSAEGFLTLELVAHDGVKIRAQVGADTFRREATLEREIAQAQRMVEELERQGDSEPESHRRRQAARQRAARERSGRLQLAVKELEKIREGRRTGAEREQARVSLTEPEARLMKHGDNAIAPSYNLQLSTDAANNIIVGMHLTQSSSDSGALLPAMEEVKQTLGQYPRAVVADGGFTNRASIGEMQEHGMEFYGSMSEPAARQAAAMQAAGIDPAFGPSFFTVNAENQTLQCPAGKTLRYVRQSKKRDDLYHPYQAQAGDCGTCGFQKQCCPKHPEQGRLVSIRMTENAQVSEFREKMKTEEAKKIYKRRGPVAEFPNAWIKEKLGIRKFRLRGMRKAAAEALWGVLTYDVMQWLRLSWKPKRAAAMAA